jgi:group II intron reverse transcriptase/maturase
VLAQQDQTSWGRSGLLEAALSRQNMAAAWKRVKANGGSAGVDGQTVQQTGQWLRSQWPAIRQRIRDGEYRPNAVRAVGIPKAGGGTRTLGIPTVLDRLIQQALLQVLQPLIDPSFSEHSHGFRPGRSAHGAIVQAQRYVQQGYRVVVDVDLEKFFDRVNHDILMDRLSKRIGDKAVLKLVRHYLNAGMMADGVVQARREGTPQGGPLSPLLANVLLDEVDRELERRGHRFVRYADDCNVYVRSRRAGERVLAGLRGLYAKLRLRINEAKTAVSEVWSRTFLGYRMWRNRAARIGVTMAPQSEQRYRQRIRELTRRPRGRSLPQVLKDLRAFVPGWKAYFQLESNVRRLQDLDGWLRRRLRALQLAHWKRGPTIYRELRKLGVPARTANDLAGGHGRWWCMSRVANTALPVAYFDRLGVPRLY